jgi:hypothetical protein
LITLIWSATESIEQGHGRPQPPHYALNREGNLSEIKKVDYLIIEFLAMNQTNRKKNCLLHVGMPLTKIFLKNYLKKKNFNFFFKFFFYTIFFGKTSFLL